MLWISLWLVIFGVNLWGTWRALKLVSRKKRRNPIEILPGVSIIKPLKGDEQNLEENLRRFFTLNYPLYELLFCVTDAHDPAALIVNNLMREFPDCSARLLIGKDARSINPKISNMMKAYNQAEYDCILVSDSGVTVQSDYLNNLVAHLESDVGLVSALVVARHSKSFGARMEATYLNSYFSRGLVLASSFGHPCVIGKSMLFKKSVAERFGGFRFLGDYLAEDYMFAYAIRRLGLKIVLSEEPLYQSLGAHRLKDFWARHLRWARMRKASAPIWHLFEPFTNALPLSLVCALGANLSGGGGFFSVFLAMLGAWFLMDLSLLHFYEGRLKLSMFSSWVAREIVGIPLWMWSLVSNRVKWKSESFILEPGGRVRQSAEQSFANTLLQRA